MTFWESHSRVIEKATHKICCILSADPMLVLTVARQSPLMDQRCSQVALQVAMSPVKSFMAMAETTPTWSRSCRTKMKRLMSHTIAVPSRDPDTMILYAGLAARQVTASVCPCSECFTFNDFCRELNSHTVTTELVPAVIIVLALGEAQARISPECAVVSQTNIARSLSYMPIRSEWSAKPHAMYREKVGGMRTLFCSTASTTLSGWIIWPTGLLSSMKEKTGN